MSIFLLRNVTSTGTASPLVSAYLLDHLIAALTNATFSEVNVEVKL